MSHPPKPSLVRQPSLDGLRGLAILIVIVHTAFWIAGPSRVTVLHLAGTVADAGWVGVQLFFVLSGFLITGILLDDRGSRAYLRTFWVRRSLRIFPLYFAFLALVVIIGPHIVRDPSWASSLHRDQWWYWTYLINWSHPFGVGVDGLPHLWSLAVEEQFYLLWPFVVLFNSRTRLRNICIGIVCLTPAIRVLLHAAQLPPYAAYTFTIARWDALAIGALLAILWRDERDRTILLRVHRPIALSACAVTAAVFLCERGFSGTAVVVQVVGQTCTAVLGAELLLLCLDRSGGSNGWHRLFSVRWLRTLGKFSYAMYLFHAPLHLGIEGSLHATVNGADSPWRLLRLVLYTGLLLGLSFLAARVSWTFVEQPFLNLKDRLAPRPVSPGEEPREDDGEPRAPARQR